MPPENLLNPNRRNLDGSTQVFQESSRYNRLVSLGCLLARRLGREVTLTIPQTNLSLSLSLYLSAGLRALVLSLSLFFRRGWGGELPPHRAQVRPRMLRLPIAP